MPKRALAFVKFAMPLGPPFARLERKKKTIKQHNTADDIRCCRAVPRVARWQIVIALERPGCVLLGDQIVEVRAELLGIADFCRDGGGGVAVSSHLHGKAASFQRERGDLFIAEQVQHVRILKRLGAVWRKQAAYQKQRHGQHHKQNEKTRRF